MILVTGSTGLVGSHLIYDLLRKGYQVKALVRKSSNKDRILQTFKFYSSEAEELYTRITWVEGDVTDIVALDEAFSDVDEIYHAAALVSFHPRDKKEIYRVNVDGTSNIVNLCLERNIKKLCFVSSIGALGVTEDGSPITEDVSWKPSKNTSAYSMSKFKAEMEVWRGITEGLNAVIVNPSVILGPGYWKNSSASVFPLIDKGLSFYSKGITGFVDVKDVTKAMIILMESNISNERYVLSSENISYKAFFEMVANSLHVKPPYLSLSPFMSGIAWRLEFIRSRLLFSTPKITRSTMTIAHKKLLYSSEKIQSQFNIEFNKIETIIPELNKYYQLLKKTVNKSQNIDESDRK
jgi:nucleoside-diphosphate-sugar epimerase